MYEALVRRIRRGYEKCGLPVCTCQYRERNLSGEVIACCPLTALAVDMGMAVDDESTVQYLMDKGFKWLWVVDCADGVDNSYARFNKRPGHRVGIAIAEALGLRPKKEAA